MDAALPSCPPCPKCWSSSAVSFTRLTTKGIFCRCERCGTVWFHDNERLAAILRDRGFVSENETNPSNVAAADDSNIDKPDQPGDER